jgi:hypothetical protein
MVKWKQDKETNNDLQNTTQKTKDYVRGFMFYLFVLYLFKHTGVQHDFHVRWCSCSLTVIQRVSLVEQKLLSLPGHLGSPPVFSGARSLVFCVVFCRSLFVSLSCFHLTIVLYVLLRLTNSDYPFGIFKLFSPVVLLLNYTNIIWHGNRVVHQYA